MAAIRQEVTQFSDLIGELYESVLDPERLLESIRQVAAWLGVDSSYFIGWDRSCIAPRMAVVNEPGGRDAVDPEYLNHYKQLDPRWSLMTGAPMGQVMTCAQYFDDRFVSRNEFFQKFLLPRGRRHTMVAHLYRDERFNFYATFYHAVGRESFSADQVERAQALVPHLQRVARLLVQHEGAGVLAELGEGGLDALDQGVLALDARGEILFANQRARALQREGRWLVSHGLRVRPAVGAPAALDDVVTRVIATGVPDGLVLRRADSTASPWCGVTVLRLPAGCDQHLTALYPRACALVLVNVPNAQRCVTATQLMQMFGLTQAEARLAQALTRGQSVDVYAQEQGVSLPTVRSQVRSVLHKTEAGRQQDLVRMLASLPSARPPVGV